MNEPHFVPAAQSSDVIAAEFPRASGTTYLSTCSTGLLPHSAREAVHRLLDRRVEGDMDKAALFATIETVRANFAALIQATADEIAITKNVSEGLSIIAGALPWQPGDNVVVCLDLEHPNNVYPWFNLRERVGVEVRSVPQRDGHIPAEAVAAAIDGRTRLVSLSTVSFSPGFRTDIAPVSAVCRERDVFLLADGVQSVGILDTDVDELGVDALAVSTQKGLLGLYGFGFLYCRRARAEALRPMSLARFGVDLGATAHEAAKGTDQYTLMAGARRFDLGNYNYPGAVACDQSLQVIAGIGTKVIEAHVISLSHRLVRGLLDLGLPVAGGEPGAHLGSIVCIGHFGAGGHDNTEDAEMADLYEYLTRHGVVLTIRQGMLRMAFHIYNTEDDVDRVLELCRAWQRRN